MINFDNVTKKGTKRRNLNWPQIPDYPYRILVIGDSWFGKTKSLFDIISYQPDIDKIYLLAKDPYEAHYQLLNNKRESTALNNLNCY